MASFFTHLTKQGVTLLFVIVAQLLCAIFFVFDVVSDMESLASAAHLVPEGLATLALLIGVVVEIRVLSALLRQQQQLKQGLAVASGALASVMENYFQQWKLTAAEQDVASFTIKGYSIAEISDLRGSAEATVKAQLNAIYRKSGTQGRMQLVSVLVEDLLRAPLPEPSAGNRLASIASDQGNGPVANR